MLRDAQNRSVASHIIRIRNKTINNSKLIYDKTKSVRRIAQRWRHVRPAECEMCQLSVSAGGCVLLVSNFIGRGPWSPHRMQPRRHALYSKGRGEADDYSLLYSI